MLLFKHTPLGAVTYRRLVIIEVVGADTTTGLQWLCPKLDISDGLQLSLMLSSTVPRRRTAYGHGEGHGPGPGPGMEPMVFSKFPKS